MPHFEAAVTELNRVHRCLYGVESIAWDVAVGPDGPLILEGNASWEGRITMLLDPSFAERFRALYRL